MNQYHFIREGQPGSELFTFVVPAQDLITIGRVERFNETRGGVQRHLNYGHVEKLKRFMLTSHATFAEPILGNLEGEWNMDKKTNTITKGESGYLSVDDGQQRLAALHLLTETQRAKWEFKVTATLNLPYDQRVQRFLQQLQRLKVDTHLILQMQDRTSAFPDAIQAKAYQIAKSLATEENSPLQGLIRMDERVPGKQPVGEDANLLASLLSAPATVIREQTVGMINISNIFRQLRKTISSAQSIILHHDPSAQYQVIARVLTAAQATWPNAWDNPKHYFLRRAVGINALLELLVVGQHFKSFLTTESKISRKSDVVKSVTVGSRELKLEQIMEVLDIARQYDWSYQRYRLPNVKFPSATEIAQGIDSLIFQKLMPKRRTASPQAANG